LTDYFDGLMKKSDYIEINFWYQVSRQRQIMIFRSGIAEA